jgi:hypothetical protein
MAGADGLFAGEGAESVAGFLNVRRRQKVEHNQQNCPTGKSIPIYGILVKPQNKKYFAFSEQQTALYHIHPVPLRGVS